MRYLQHLRILSPVARVVASAVARLGAAAVIVCLTQRREENYLLPETQTVLKRVTSLSLSKQKKTYKI